jgi:hypothetical protein
MVILCSYAAALKASFVAMLSLFSLSLSVSAHAQGSVPCEAARVEHINVALNDRIADAEIILSSRGCTTGSTARATGELGEPSNAAVGELNSVWYSFSAQNSTLVTFSVVSDEGSQFQPIISAFGEEGSILTESNTLLESHGRSEISFQTTLNSTYFIRVDGLSSQRGIFILHWSGIEIKENDNIESAVDLFYGANVIYGDNGSATLQAGESAIDFLGHDKSVWFRIDVDYISHLAVALLVAQDGIATPRTGDCVVFFERVAEGIDGLSSGNSAGGLSFELLPETTYYLMVSRNPECQYSGPYQLVAVVKPGGLNDNVEKGYAAVLPQARSVTIGSVATAFATILNPTSVGAGDGALRNCRIELPNSLASDGWLDYQTTDRSNALIGTPNTPVDIQPGQSQSFVFGLGTAVPIEGQSLSLRFRCDNAPDIKSIEGVNTLTLTSSRTPTPDIVALAASDNGNVNLGWQFGVFAVATINTGVSGTVVATVDTGEAGLPVKLYLCETDPVTSVCISPLGTSVTTQFVAGGTGTFGVFVQRAGSFGYSPASNRVFVRFRWGSIDGPLVGATSVAVDGGKHLGGMGISQVY